MIIDSFCLALRSVWIDLDTFFSFNSFWLHCMANWILVSLLKGLPCGSNGEESVYNAGDLGSIPWSERSPGEGNGNPLQYSCLGNLMDRGAWWAIVHEVTERSQSRTRLSASSSSPLTRDQTYAPFAVEAWSLKRWAAREVPNLNTFLILKKCPAEGGNLARRHNQGQRVT